MMEAFTTVTAGATVFDRANVDTDLIIPARHLKTISRTGLGRFAFESLRYTETGEPRNGSPFDGPARQNQVLITGDNFGCGSSREHAVWALMDLGYKVILAPSFADIFRTNAVRNGLLCIECLPELLHLFGALTRAGFDLTVDLEKQEIAVLGVPGVPFDYPAEARAVLLAGLDEIGATLKAESDITEFESHGHASAPWLYPAAPETSA